MLLSPPISELFCLQFRNGHHPDGIYLGSYIDSKLRVVLIDRERPGIRW